MSKYKGVTYQNGINKFKAICKVHGKTTIIGLFDTAEEAGKAYIDFSVNVVRELTTSDRKRIEQYKDFANYCETPKLISEAFANFKQSSTTSVRYIYRMLEAGGFVKTRLIEGIGQSKLEITKLKDFTDDAYIPRSRMQALALMNRDYDEIEKVLMPTILGARVIKECHPTRVVRSSPRSWVSGSSLSAAV